MVYPRDNPTTPMADATTPPTSIHIALSVGEPVKKREMSEVNDVAAMKKDYEMTMACLECRAGPGNLHRAISGVSA
jgi:hypothetical protein